VDEEQGAYRATARPTPHGLPQRTHAAFQDDLDFIKVQSRANLPTRARAVHEFPRAYNEEWRDVGGRPGEPLHSRVFPLVGGYP